jgi:hypothetical protein
MIVEWSVAEDGSGISLSATSPSDQETFSGVISAEAAATVSADWNTNVAGWLKACGDRLQAQDGAITLVEASD